MATQEPVASSPLWLPPPAEVCRITVDLYDGMVMSGRLDEDSPIELIGGIMVTKMPKNPRYMWSVEAARDLLAKLLPRGWSIRQEGPVRLPNFDQPEPDLAVIRGTCDDYRNRYPGPGDIGLIVEVAETSLARDRGEKLAAYARGGIPVYWIVNLVDRQVEVHTNPTAGVYPVPTMLDEQTSVDLIIDGQPLGRIAVTDILPRA